MFAVDTDAFITCFIDFSLCLCVCYNLRMTGMRVDSSDGALLPDA